MKLGTIDIEKIYVGSNEIEKGYVGSSMVYEENSGPDYSKTPLCLESVNGSNLNIYFYVNCYYNGNDYYSDLSKTLEIQYSYDNVNWTSTTINGDVGWPGASGKHSVYRTLSTTSPKVYLRTNNQIYKYYKSSGSYPNQLSHISLDANTDFNVYGNITSMYYGSSFNGQRNYGSTNAFGYGFFTQSKVVDASNLVLPNSLITLNGNYGQFGRMFSQCTKLISPPELPATTLVKSCYYNIFYGCSKLTYIKVGFTAWPDMSSSSASNYRATYEWTNLTQNTTGTFVCPAALPQQFNASGNNTSGSSLSNASNAIPYGWTVQTY